MTGYGKSECETGGRHIIVEIRSLNNKQLDITTRITSLYRDKELEIRNMLTRALLRGKIEISLFFDPSDITLLPQINADVVRSYITQIEAIAKDTSLDISGQLLQTAMSLPDVLKTERITPTEEDWLKVTECITSALRAVNDFREQEGKAMEADIRKRIGIILDLLGETDKFEKDKLSTIRARLLQNLRELEVKGSFDTGRLEQEMIFYLEKLDSTEEKVRLKNHCSYFLETMASETPAGKKLGFIAQEMGREINTLGSKANDLNVQRLVVEMKDELEKIREQVLNIL
jgi:uncharacterized protein (TIGR00255 family)